MYGKKANENAPVGFEIVNASKRAEAACHKDKEITVEKFLTFAKNNRAIIMPTLNLWKACRENLGGTQWWSRREEQCSKTRFLEGRAWAWLGIDTASEVGM